MEFWCTAADWQRTLDASVRVFDDMLRSLQRGVDTQLLSWASWEALLGKTIDEALHQNVGLGDDKGVERIATPSTR